MGVHSRQELMGNTPKFIVQHLNFINGDGNSMDNREITGSFNNSELNDVNVQSDIYSEYNLREEDFENLKTDIEKADISEVAVQQNNYFLEDLKTSLKEKDKDNAKKILGWIKDSIGSTAAILTIESLL